MKKLLSFVLLNALFSSSSAFAKSDTAVVYFSATNTTEAVAKILAEVAQADLFKIEPAQPYSNADLNWHDDNCRANKESQDATARPTIANDLNAIVDYDLIYIGYPIWWYTAPKIINTLLEKYDLIDSDIRLFCTSGGSTADKSLEDLRALYPQLHFIDATRLHKNDSADQLREWTSKY